MRSAETGRQADQPKLLPLWPILIATLVLLFPFHLRPDRFIVDDGYFYPQIAREIVRGHGSTFNGIMPTNGYHPLWMGVCVLGALITSAAGPLIQILATVQDALTLLSIALLVQISRTAAKRGAVVGCTVFWFFNVVLGIWRLLETNLALTLQLVTLVLLVPVLPHLRQKIGRWNDTALGAALGLTLLSRLDLIFFILVVLVYELVRHELHTSLWRRIKVIVWQSVIVSALVAPYLIWNMTRFHHILPISGAIKSTFPHAHAWSVPLFAFPVLAAILFSAFLSLKQRRTHFDVLCLITGAASALHLAYTLSFGGLAPWYLTTGYLCVALCAINLTDLLLKATSNFSWLEPAFAVVVFLAFLSLASLRLFSNFTYSRFMHHKVSLLGSYSEPKHALAERLRQTLPQDSRVFIFDAPGGVAFYSGLSILPADGLVSDYSYNLELPRIGFARYAAQHNIGYIIAPYLQPGQLYDRLDLRSKRTEAGQMVEVVAPLTGQDAGTVILRNEDLLFRFPEINPDMESEFPEVGVWRLSH